MYKIVGFSAKPMFLVDAQKAYDKAMKLYESGKIKDKPYIMDLSTGEIVKNIKKKRKELPKMPLAKVAPSAYVAVNEFVFNGLEVRKCAIMAINDLDEPVVCMDFPLYKNKKGYPILKVWRYNEDFDYWEESVEQNELTKYIYQAWYKVRKQIPRTWIPEQIEFSNNVYRKQKTTAIKRGSQRVASRRVRNAGEVPMSYGEQCMSRTFTKQNYTVDQSKL